LTNRLSTPILS